MNNADLKFVVGVDWATEEHEVCITDSERAVKATRSVRHEADALREFGDYLLKLADGDPSKVAVSIERPDGPLVEMLIELGFPVYVINPKQLDRFRDRHTISGAKSDRGDAFVLSVSLWTDRPLFRLVKPDAPEFIELRAMTRLYDDLTSQFVACSNKLREQLHRYYPQALALKAIDAPWFWKLLEGAPTPAAAKRLRSTPIAALLKKHRIRVVDAATVLNTLRATSVTVTPGVIEGASFQVTSLIRQMRLLHDEKTRCMRAIEQMVERVAAFETLAGPRADGEAKEPSEGQRNEHRDVEIIQSLPGAGIGFVATMLAEASQLLAARDYPTIRLRTGAAPVTFQTGKQKQRGSTKKKYKQPPPQISMRRSCNHWLRNALHHAASNAKAIDPRWRAIYEDARSRGSTHACALRKVGDRMLDTMVAMLKTRTLYDAEFRTKQLRAA